MELKSLPIGVSDFKKIITGGYYYVDKSLLIKELLEAKAEVTLLPRPRRFGKTLNMTMLKYFFEKTDSSIQQRLISFDMDSTSLHYAHHERPAKECVRPECSKCNEPFDLAQDRLHRTGTSAALFANLEIAKHPDCMEHQGQYPVIFLTFKDIKNDTWQDCYEKLKQCISTEFERHNYILNGNELTAQQREDFNQIINRTAPQATYENSLKDLSSYLQKHHGAKTVILIDEYDSPIHAGFVYDYYNKIVSFMRGFMCGGLKDNVNVAHGVVTGILRVAKESIFSGMNNLKVCSLLSSNFSDKFGLTEPEVKSLLAAHNLPHKLDDVRSWYNGYRVGQAKVDGSFTMVYNPWSIINFIDEKGVFGTYWVNTSDNRIIQELVQKASEDVKEDFELILAKKSVSKTICEDIVFSAIYNDSNALWSFLVFSGYLTWQSRELMQVKCQADLCVPNHEVLDCLKTLVDRWFSESMGSKTYQNILEALRQGNVPAFERYFQQSVIDSLSFFDISGTKPERVYHAYVLGMLVGLGSTHVVKSNRESGLGRYDVCLIPNDKSKPGTIIEFKAFNPKEHPDIEKAAQAALDQIEEKQYEAELRSHGIQKIIKLGIVFDGKVVLIVSK